MFVIDEKKRREFLVLVGILKQFKLALVFLFILARIYLC